MARIQEAYIGAPVKPARYYHRSPADLGVEEVQAYLLPFIAGSTNFTGIFSETEPGRSLSKQLRSPSTRGERGEMTGILSQSFPEASGSTGAIEVKVEEGMAITGGGIVSTATATSAPAPAGAISIDAGRLTPA